MEDKLADMGSKIEEQGLQVELFEDKVDDFDGNMLLMRMKSEEAMGKLNGRVVALEQEFRQKLQEEIFTQLDADGEFEPARGWLPSGSISRQGALWHHMFV
jgi:hypothetical protein